MPRKLTTKEFVERARKVHGDRYGYDNVVYTGGKDKVMIRCFTHGDFEQTPCDHLSGYGCQKCAGKYRPTSEEFIERAREVHGGKYGYDKVIYNNNRTKVTLSCPEHGDFEQTAKDHLQGKGCAKCAGRALLTTEEFIEKSVLIHGERYDYSNSRYVNNRTKILISCCTHGAFLQKPTHHLSGIGCPSCSTGGYSPAKTGYIYFLLDTDTHSRVKVGISNKPDYRIRQLRRATPFSIEPMRILPVGGTHAPMIEKLAHNSLVSANLTGFDGATEWFNYDGEAVNQLIEFCDHHLQL